MVTLNDFRLKIGRTKGAGKLKDILEASGEFAISMSQDAFQRQRMGNVKWPPRYPNQRPFVINVAGAVSDISAGGTVKSRRFKAKPAAIDTGRLRNSVAKRITGPESVEVGSNLPYASRINSGGRSVMPVTKKVRRGLAWFLKRLPKARKRAVSRRMGFLFQTNTLSTKSPARPFIPSRKNGGIQRLEKDVAALVKAKLEGRL